jgi:hypothetical protein
VKVSRYRRIYFLIADDEYFLEVNGSEDQFADPEYSPSWGYSFVPFGLSFVENVSSNVRTFGLGKCVRLKP